MNNQNRWQMYDELIRPIPEDLFVEDYVAGGHFACLRSGDLCGLAYDTRGSSRPPMLEGSPVGMRLREAAELAKSWNMEEATIGMAAINAFHNDPNRLSELGVRLPDLTGATVEDRKAGNPIGGDMKRLRGKKVAMIGHFRHAEQKLSGLADLYILERRTSPGDYPDSACEYLLPEMDYILSTAVTLINKTAGRLMELKGENGYFTFMGPTTTLSPTLFRYGADSLAGFVVTDPDYVRDVIARNVKGLFEGGVMVDLTREDFR